VPLYVGTAKAGLLPVRVAWTVRSLLLLSSCSARKRTELTWTWSLPSRETAHEEVFWSLAVLVVILLMRRLLMRVFSAGLRSSFHPWAKARPLKGPRSRWTGILGIQNTDSSPREPGSRTRPLEGAKGQGPPEAAGPSNGTRQCAVRGPCEDAEVADVWNDCSWRDEAAWRSCAVQGLTGVSNRRIKGDVLETVPSLPPLKLSREGSFSSFIAHCRYCSPFRRTCTSRSL
jgi:hypothetical protein